MFALWYPVPVSQMRKSARDEITRKTLEHYDPGSEDFWHSTKHHDVSQNIEALLDELGGPGPHRILDLGCGPGRDLIAFRDLGHHPVGLDGTLAFVEKARTLAAVEVLHQNFLSLDLPREQLTIKVTSPGSAGIFGLLRKKAVILSH